MSTLTITRIAHSSVLIDFDGQRVLTDPWFSERFGYYHGEPYGITLEALPRLSGVVVSHDHYDHYDMNAFQAYPDKQVPIAVKGGTEQKARRVGFANVIAMEAWETTTFGPITVTAAPGKHGVPEITYLLQAFGLSVYFGGDTLLIPELSEIPQRFGRVDVALLAINGLQIRFLGNRQDVMNPQDAAEFCRITRPRYAVPFHSKYKKRRKSMTSTLSREQVAARKLWWVGPLTIISAALANSIIRTIAVAFFGVPGTFWYFQAAYVIGSTIMYLLLALIAFVLVSRFARRPIRFYRVLALVALLISFLIPAMALGGLMPIPGMNAPIFWTMIVMHSVSAVIVVGLLTTLTREQA